MQRQTKHSRFRLRIGEPRIIGATFEIGIIEIDAAKSVSVRTECDDTGARGTNEGGPQLAGELKVAKMVGGELRLVTAGIPHQRRRHDTRIVDQEMKRIGGGENVLGKAIDRCGIEQIHPVHDDIGHLAQGMFGLGHVACGDEDLCTGRTQHADGFQADTGIPSGDNDVFTG